MINITIKELEIESELKRKIEFICDFCNTKPTIINGNIRNITKTNLSYIEPHRIIIKGITISFAGMPIINAASITPSSPIIWANGSKKSER